MLNEARKQVPTSVEIWISAAKLEETHGNYDMVRRRDHELFCVAHYNCCWYFLIMMSG